VTDIADLSDIAADLDWLDYEAETRAHDAVVARRDLGRLAGLIEWLAGVQGQFPIREISRPRLVLVASDHEIAGTGVSTLSPDDTARTIAAIASGDAPLSDFAARSGTGIRVEELAADSSVIAAIQRGAAIADAEIDAGTDLIIVGNIGAGSTTTAAAAISILADVEPIKVIGRGGSGIDDTAWMHKVSAVRDARRRGRPAGAIRSDCSPR